MYIKFNPSQIVGNISVISMEQKQNLNTKKIIFGKEKHHFGLFINGTPIICNPILQLPYQPRLKESARALRQAKNLPEVLFWMQVSKRKFHCIDFDRQRVIGNYIVDFYAKKLGLVIEIDGDSHNDKVNYDMIRERYLASLGLRIYRITVDDVMRDMYFVLMGLENYIIKEYGIQADNTPSAAHPPL